MADDFTWNDRYAGDAAWTEWFEICSVSGCSPDVSRALRAEVESAMYAHLAKCGLSREDAGSEDPVAFFDSYFKLKGSRETKKPLKSYFAHRIEVEKIPMLSFVCGTLFGSASGRIRSIVIDWVAALKGWKPRTVYGPDGTRHLEWEQASAADIDLPAGTVPEDFLGTVPQGSAGRAPGDFLDEEPIIREIAIILARISAKIKVEKSVVALLLYATAQDISITEAVVLEALGTGKSRAYAIREKALKELRRELKTVEGADDPLFGRLLLESCAAALPDETRRKLGCEE